MTEFTDKELLDALDDAGNGIAVLHDDDEHWFVCGDGMQNVVVDGPKAFNTTHCIMDDDVPHARKTVRDAIAAWIIRDERDD
jgi:hypothetical protein